MPRANAMAPDAIRIEDEVWQEAFARREPARPNRRRLEAVDGGRAALRTSGDAPRTAAPTVPPAAQAVPSGSHAALAARAAAIPMTPVPAVSPPREVVAALPSTSTASSPARRTVKIQGRGAERNLPVPDPLRRRPTRRAYERAGFRPDRVAMWAVVLGIMLILVAVASGHG